MAQPYEAVEDTVRHLENDYKKMVSFMPESPDCNSAGMCVYLLKADLERSKCQCKQYYHQVKFQKKIVCVS